MIVHTAVSKLPLSGGLLVRPRRGIVKIEHHLGELTGTNRAVVRLHSHGGGQGDRAFDRGLELRVQALDPGEGGARVRQERDDLRAVIALVKGKDLGIALQFTNYRSTQRCP